MSASELIQRKNRLAADRGNFESLWQEVADVMNPHGGDYNRKRSPGERRTDRLYEMTAANARAKFIAAMEAFHVPRTQRWHHLRASDEDLNEVNAVRDWFDEAENVLFKLRANPRARFYGQMFEVFGSLADTGNGCLFVDEGPQGGVRYRYNHVGQTYIETNFEGVVDTIYYGYELSARAAVQKWGDKAPRTAQQAAASDPLMRHKYLHVVRPNRDRDRDRQDARGKPWESLEIAVEEEAYIGSPGGFDEMPYLWTRYTVNPAEMYGRGPGVLVLPDVLTLQEMQKTILRAGHKVVDPPLLVRDDRVLGRGAKKIRLEPGGLNMGGLDAEGRPLIQPLQTGARLDVNEAIMERLRDNIREAFLNNHFDLLVQDRVQMTATEVLERAKEKGQLLTPVIGRQQSELLGPLIERELGIAQRQGLLPPLPQELVEAEGEYEIEYESDATRMQKSDQVAAFLRMQEVMGVVIQANPQILDKIDAEAAIEHFGEELGVPAKLFRTEEDMEAIHAQRQEEAQAAQMAQQAPAIAGAVRDLSQAVA